MSNKIYIPVISPKKKKKVQMEFGTYPQYTEDGGEEPTKEAYSIKSHEHHLSEGVHDFLV